MGEIDQRTRLRIAAKLRILRFEHRFPSDAAMARACGISRGAINRALKGERTVGLDVVLKVHRSLGVSLDWLIERDPEDSHWWDPNYWPSTPTPPSPHRHR